MSGHFTPERRWLRPPRLRTLAREPGERHASWLELFFDLVLVVAIAQLAHLFVHHPDLHGALLAGGLFLAVFLAWQGFSFYADRFDTDDLPFRLAAFAQMLALLTLALQLREVAEGRYAGFAFAFALLRAILVVLYVRAYLHAPEARPLIRRYGGVYAFSVFLWLVSTALPSPWTLALWGFAIALDLATPPLSAGIHRRVPTDSAHVPERFGLFTLIVLGELVVAVGAGVVDARWNPDAVAIAVGGFAMAACLWWLYFERLTAQELRRRPSSTLIFAYAHIPLLGALMFVASGVGILIKAEPAAGRAGTLALCLGAATFLLALIAVHRQLNVSLWASVARARGLAVVALLGLAWLSTTPVAVVGVSCAVLVALLTYEAISCAPLVEAGASAHRDGADDADVRPEG